MSMAAMMAMRANQSRQRDDRGRYMEGEQNYGYARMDQMRTQPREMHWQEPHIPPYGDRRYDGRMNDRPMDHDNPDGDSPYGGQPEVYRKQEEGRKGSDMRKSERGMRWDEEDMPRNYGAMRQSDAGKTSGGEINYNRPDGGYGNLSYFVHKTDPVNQKDGQERFEKPRQIGFGQQEKEDGHGFDKQTAMEWVENMEDGEGVKGGRYTWHQAQQYAMNKGITGEKRLIEFYAAMNAMYSDYHDVAKKFGVDKPEFYACMAKAFIEDPDAVDDKLAMYYKHVVRHDE